MFNIFGKMNAIRSNAAWLTLAPSLIAASKEFALIPNSTQRASLRTLASSSEFTDFEQMSILIRRCVIIQSSLIKRKIIAIASPCLVLPSNITETSLVISSPGKDSSFFILSTSCLKIRETYCPRCALWVRRYPFFSSKGRSLSTFPIGIPAFKNSSTTSCRYACSANGSVLSLRVFSLLSASAIACSLNLDLFSASFPLACFLELQCDAKMLFLDDTISLQALQKIVVPLTLRCWSGNWLIRSCKGTFFTLVTLLVPLLLYFPVVDFEASIPGKLCRLWSILSVLASL